MTVHERIRRFNTADTYPGQGLDNARQITRPGANAPTKCGDCHKK